MLGLSLWLSSWFCAHFQLDLGGSLQLRGGYTQTPALYSPTGAPLLNTPSSSEATGLMIVLLSPQLSLGNVTPKTFFTIGYKPNVYFTFFESTQTAATVYHRFNADITLGQKTGLFAALDATYTLGGIDTNSPGATAAAFAGSLNTQNSAGLFSFFSAALVGTLEIPLVARWRLFSKNSVGQYSTPPIGLTSVIGSSQNIATGSIAALSAPSTLQSQQRFDTQNGFRYQLAPQATLECSTLYNMVSFNGLGTYIGVTPYASIDVQRQATTSWSLGLGLLRYWNNPYPGVFEHVSNLLLPSISVQHRFVRLKLPKLSLVASLQTTPYYDYFYGYLVPRTSLNINVRYQFNQAWSLSVQARDYTPLYWLGAWRTIPPGYTSNIAVLTTQVNYRASRYLSWNLGLFGDIASLEPSNTSTYLYTEQVYIYTGIESTWGLR